MPPANGGRHFLKIFCFLNFESLHYTLRVCRSRSKLKKQKKNMIKSRKHAIFLLSKAKDAYEEKGLVADAVFMDVLRAYIIANVANDETAADA